jgi:hypothetical protein
MTALQLAQEMLTPDARIPLSRGICGDCGREVALYRNGMVGTHRATRIRAEYQPDGTVIGVPYLVAGEQCAGRSYPPVVTV